MAALGRNKTNDSMSRTKIPSEVETQVLKSTRRRCPLCYYVDYFEGVVEGQIAHLNHDPNDNGFENLAFLCLKHHSLFDSTNSQHKNFTINEVKYYRNLLIQRFEENPRFDLVRDSIDPKYYLQLDGLMKLVCCQTESTHFSDIYFSLRYKIASDSQPGYVFCITDERTRPRIFAYYKFKEDDQIVRRIGVFSADQEGNKRLLFSFSSEDAPSIIELKIEDSRTVACFNNQKCYSYERIPDFVSEKIYIGGLLREGPRGATKLQVSEALMKNHQAKRVIFDFDFTHGKEHIHSCRDLSKITFYNMVSYDFNNIN